MSVSRFLRLDNRSMVALAALISSVGFAHLCRGQVIEVIAATDTNHPDIGYASLLLPGPRAGQIAGGGPPAMNASGDIAFFAKKNSEPADAYSGYATWTYTGGVYAQRTSYGPSNPFYLCNSVEPRIFVRNAPEVIVLGDQGQLYCIGTVLLADGMSATISWADVDDSGRPLPQNQLDSGPASGLFGLTSNGWLWGDSNGNAAFNTTECLPGQIFSYLDGCLQYEFTDGVVRGPRGIITGAIAADGGVALNAGLRLTACGSVPSFVETSVMYTDGSQWHLVATEGATAPGWPGNRPWIQFGTVSISDSDLAFEASMDFVAGSVASAGIWLAPGRTGFPILVAYGREASTGNPGMAVPLDAPSSSPGWGTIYGILDWQLNSNGEIVFSANVDTGFGYNLTRVYVATSSTIRLVSGLSDDDGIRAYPGILPRINNQGRVAFLGNYYNSISAPEGAGAVIMENNEGLQVGLKVGDTIAIPDPLPGNPSHLDARVVVHISVRDSFPAQGRRPGADIGTGRFISDTGKVSAFVQLVDSEGETSYADVLISVLDGDPCVSFPDRASARCSGDWNADGVVEQGGDVFRYMELTSGTEDVSCYDLDINHDGVVDQGDVDALIDQIAGGSTPPDCGS